MNRNSKSRFEKIKKIERNLKSLKGQLPHLDEEVLQTIEAATRLERLSSKREFPSTVAVSTEIPGEEEVYILKFDYLRPQECRYTEANPRVLERLVEIFTVVTTTTPNEFGKTRLIRDSVSNTGSYQSLFTNLSPDVTKLDEIELPERGRLFCFRQSNHFNIVSIETNHRDSH